MGGEPKSVRRESDGWFIIERVKWGLYIKLIKNGYILDILKNRMIVYEK